MNKISNIIINRFFVLYYTKEINNNNIIIQKIQIINIFVRHFQKIDFRNQNTNIDI